MFNVDTRNAKLAFTVDQNQVLAAMVEGARRREFDETPLARQLANGLADLREVARTPSAVARLLGGEALTARAEATWWIVKRQEGTFLSKGIFLAVLDKADAVDVALTLKWLTGHFAPPSCRHERKAKKCLGRVVTFQRYVHQPLLALNRKFDFRVLALVLNVDPLRVYIMRLAFPKIASMDYDPSPDKVSSRDFLSRARRLSLVVSHTHAPRRFKGGG